MSNYKYNTEQLHSINELLKVNVESILDEFGVSRKYFGDRMAGPCPVHGGNNSGAFSLRNGWWTCYTHHCEKEFGKNLISLVRGLLSHEQFGWTDKNDKKIGFNDTISWILRFFKTDISTLKIYSVPDFDANKQDAILNKKLKENKPIITREQVRKKLRIPAEYLLSRGYRKDIIDSYDIGLCTEKYKPMSNRIVVPIYDDNHKYMVSCLGRSIFDECPKCKLYHSGACPAQEAIWHKKWINSENFHRDSSLFNYWNALAHIKRTGNVILVEGPLDVLRLEQEGIHNSVAVYGSTMTDGQSIILERLPLQNIIVAFDNDEAGKNGSKKVLEEYGHLCKIKQFQYQSKDIGLATSQEIEDIKKIAEKI